jgi:hypothetical protein
MKKRLLKEETTRRFMKLANLSPLNETYFEEEVGDGEVPEEDPEAEMVDDVAPEMGEPELDAGPAGEGCTDNVVSMVNAIAAAIEETTGCSMTVADDAAATDAPMDDAPMDLPEEDPVMEQTDVNEQDIDEALNEANIELTSVKEDWLMKETLRRVTKRLVEASKKNS